MNELQVNINKEIENLINNDKEIKQALLSDPNAIKYILQSVIIDELKQDIKTQKLILSIDFENEIENFLSQYESKHTKDAYKRALNEFIKYCNANNLQSPLMCNTSLADKWIYKQRQENRAPATIRRNIASVSAFYSYLERITDNNIKNVFRGTRARPKDERKTNNKFYSLGSVDAIHLQRVKQDIQTIIDNVTNNELKVIIKFMFDTGIRCGAFENMKIHDNNYKTISKGKIITGVISPELLQVLKDNDIKHNAPFTQWTENKIKCLFKYYSKKLYKQGKTNFIYSCHDIRHYFALNEYSQNKDIYKLSKLLNHTNINVTEKYLRGLYVTL